MHRENGPLGTDEWVEVQDLKKLRTDHVRLQWSWAFSLVCGVPFNFLNILWSPSF